MNKERGSPPDFCDLDLNLIWEENYQMSTITNQCIVLLVGSKAGSLNWKPQNFESLSLHTVPNLLLLEFKQPNMGIL